MSNNATHDWNFLVILPLQQPSLLTVFEKYFLLAVVLTLLHQLCSPLSKSVQKFFRYCKHCVL